MSVKNILIPIQFILISLVLTGCDAGSEQTSNKAVVNNIDRNLADLTVKIDDLNAKISKTNAVLYNIDKNIVVISSHTAAIASSAVSKK